MKLTLEGLYSYRERQTIDFTELTSAGLFGIFGATGSGKSSVLEAISFALYGNTERLNSRDSRSYNMMNLKSGRTYIEFDFQNHENRIYRVTREFKRNSKRFDDVRTITPVFYEQKEGQWIPLDHANPENLLHGLSYENFRRTIIIPQGQFKEFLELGDKDRTQMMKEIFSLHRFDLQDKTTVLLKETTAQIQRLEGELKGFGEISEGLLKEKKTLLDEQKSKQKEARELAEKQRKDLENYRSLKQEEDLLHQHLEQQKGLNQKTPEIEGRKAQLLQYEKFFRIFDHDLKTQKQFHLDLKAKKEERKTADEAVEKTTERLQLLQAKRAQLEPEYLNVDQGKRKVEDLEAIIKLKTLSAEIDLAKERTGKGTAMLRDAREEEEKIVGQIKEDKEKITELKKELPETELILEISNWYRVQEDFEKQAQKLAAQKKQNEAEIGKGQAKLTALKVDPKTFARDFAEKEETLLTQKNKLENTLAHLRLEQKLSEYSHTLHDGEACPLCGSEQHPHPVDISDVSAELRQNEEQKEILEEKIRLHQELKNQVTSLLAGLKPYGQRLEELKTEEENLQNQVAAHRKIFRWKEFSADDPKAFQEFVNQSKATQKLVDEREQQITELENKQAKVRKDVEKYRHTLEKIQREETRNQARFEEIQNNLKTLTLNDFKDLSVPQIEQQTKDISQKLEQTERDFKQAEKGLNECTTRLAKARATLDSLEKQMDEIDSKLDTINRRLDENLKLHQVENLSEVEAILSQAPDVAKERKRIENFYLQLNTLNQKIKEQKEKLGDFKSNAEVLAQKENAAKESAVALDEITKITAQLEGDLLREEKAFEAKKELLKQQAQLTQRETNLKTIYNLMKASGFVQYASMLYLQELCHAANQRFEKMTRGQLSLTLNENGSFEVIDFLNEGRSRNVKTLSGGQAFQASLSLALALAESVQSHHQSKQNFFFIDEGFGTQDQESVDLVFETLRQLQKENRIVGIISHVEALKEQIPMALEITKDPERGSLIQMI